MTRGRRAVVLGGLSLLLGGLAFSDVANRERALRRSLGAPVPVLVARADVEAGGALGARSLAVRRVPRRYAPVSGFSAPEEVAGLRAAVAIAAGTDLTPALVADPGEAGGAGVPVAPGERVAELVARGSAQLVTRGSRVDVLVTRETRDGEGETIVALEDAEVLAVSPAEAEPGDAPGPRVAVALRVALRDAVYLTAAEKFAVEVRVLPRAPGDRSRGRRGLRVGSGL